MRKILISACLLGDKVRYDGGDCQQDSEMLAKWQKEGRLVPFCPEVAGGLTVPRLPAEIQPDGRVINIEREDVSGAFQSGAEKTLQLCREQNVTIAILKEGSPSCGSSQINDGSFTKIKIDGIGITARLLRDDGVQVFSENELEKVAALLEGE